MLGSGDGGTTFAIGHLIDAPERAAVELNVQPSLRQAANGSHSTAGDAGSIASCMQTSAQ